MTPYPVPYADLKWRTASSRPSAEEAQTSASLPATPRCATGNSAFAVTSIPHAMRCDARSQHAAAGSEDMFGRAYGTYMPQTELRTRHSGAVVFRSRCKSSKETVFGSSCQPLSLDVCLHGTAFARVARFRRPCCPLQDECADLRDSNEFPRLTLVDTSRCCHNIRISNGKPCLVRNKGLLAALTWERRDICHERRIKRTCT